MTKTIFVPHEDNEASAKAIKYAIEIAKGLNMEIKLVRVVPEVLDFSTMSHWNDVERKRVKKALDRYKKNVREQEAEKLQKHVSKINSKGIKASATVVEGVNAAEKIADLVRQERPYLVVIASKRLKLRGSLAKLRMLGSVARRISEESTSPVLIVK
ncbi:universal stress protein UspA-like protein [Candidatus Nitrososphaera evergladensis SR1]|uniref:Universal stress protein UspA-like protein n=1 Tax=Candidatus Nitrososphaera evergladensis SR1 TaxID=1459636 RepID=A0A075MXX6_9ARCH|nr:universal stress protein [Candidatus Nitrososphaera evergladensis]AIF85482.1 universal stress protein UspA-like protein [Candidatus Nitrososphaera evergladensis SR1]